MIDKVKVARSFSRSALNYDSVAYLQREVGLSLLRHLGSFFDNANHPVNVLDLGCGTGFFRNKLSELFLESEYIGLDIAEGMLRFCQESILFNEKRLAGFICADAENLPLHSESLECVFSNMALQWCNDLSLLFSELNRVLCLNGSIAMTTLGPNTLCELKQAWSKVDNLVHVNDFYSSVQWREAAEAHGFVVELHKTKNMLLEFASVNELLQELKLLGAHNINEGQRKTLTGPSRIRKLLDGYAFNESRQSYTASYEVDFWVLKKIC